MKKKLIAKKVQQHVIPLAVIAIVGLSGVWLISQSKAATTNPYGYLDSCVVSGGRTYFIGWAADPQATISAQPNVTVRAGSISKTGGTTVAGYHDADINAWIDRNRAGDPKPGTYGFRIDMGVLYKDTNYAVSGTALNVGAGANTTLTVYSGSGNGASQGLTFVNNVVPANCKVARPAPPPTPPTPPVAPPTPPATPPTPPQTPPVAPRPRPATPPAPTPIPAPSSDANGGTISGTLAAIITVPTGNAAKIYLLYGNNGLGLAQKTEEITASGSEVQFTLTGLEPSSVYSYQIVRTNSVGQTATSPLVSFATADFTVSVRFVNNKSVAVPGVNASIKSTQLKGTSDKAGRIQFKGVKPGDYTIAYEYNGKKHDLPIVADAGSVSKEAANATSEANLEYFVNVDKLSVVSSVADPEPDSNRNLIFGIALAAVIALAVIIVIVNRRKHQADNPYEEVVEENYHFNTGSDDTAKPDGDENGSDEPPAAPPPVFPALDGSDNNQAPSAPPPPPPPAAPPIMPDEPASRAMYQPPVVTEHMGLSLKQMVLNSLAEEERINRAHGNQPQDTTRPDDNPHHRG